MIRRCSIESNEIITGPWPSRDPFIIEGRTILLYEHSNRAEQWGFKMRAPRALTSILPVVITSLDKCFQKRQRGLEKWRLLFVLNLLPRMCACTCTRARVIFKTIVLQSYLSSFVSPLSPALSLSLLSLPLFFSFSFEATSSTFLTTRQARGMLSWIIHSVYLTRFGIIFHR